MAAFFKASITPPVIPGERELVQKQLPLERGEERVEIPCVKVAAIHSSKSPALQSTPRSEGSGTDTGDSSQPSAHSTPVFPLLLDRIEVLPSRDPQKFEVRLEDSGLTSVVSVHQGGFARFGGERYAFIDLQSEWSQHLNRESVTVGVHQDLGRLWRVETMLEAYVGVQRIRLDSELSGSTDPVLGARLRVALPF